MLNVEKEIGNILNENVGLYKNRNLVMNIFTDLVTSILHKSISDNNHNNTKSITQNEVNSIDNFLSNLLNNTFTNNVSISNSYPDNSLKITEFILGSLSITGCLFIILVFLCYKSLRSFQFECVVYLTFSSLFSTLAYLFYYVDIREKQAEDAALCKSQAFFMVWFENAQYLWGFLIAWSTFQYVLYFEENSGRTSFVKRMKYLLIGFGLPLGFALVALSRDVFGPSLAWCWFDTSGDISDERQIEKNTFAMLAYAFMWLMILSNLYLTVKVVRFLKFNYTSQWERQITGNYIWKLLRFLVIQIVCVAPGTVNRLLLIFFDSEVYVLEVFQLVMVVSQGFVFALAYGYNPQVRAALVKTCAAYCCGCCIKSRRESESSNSQRLHDRSNDVSDSNITYYE